MRVSIKYVLTYLDSVYETLLLRLKVHKITSIFEIPWLVVTLFSSSNCLEVGPIMLIIHHGHTVVAV